MNQLALDFVSASIRPQNSREDWKPINGYPFYMVSNIGNVKRLESMVGHHKGGLKRVPEKILSPGKGLYQRISIRNKVAKTFLIHRLVALAFINNPDNKPCINHKDGNKHNNRSDNLEWCTYSENELHKIHVLGKVQIKHLRNVDLLVDPIMVNNKLMFGDKMQKLYGHFIKNKKLVIREYSMNNNLSEQSIYTMLGEMVVKYQLKLIKIQNGKTKIYELS